MYLLSSFENDTRESAVKSSMFVGKLEEDNSGDLLIAMATRVVGERRPSAQTLKPPE